MAGEGAEKAARILREMDGDKYIKSYQLLAPYVFPRLQTVDLNAEVNGGVIIKPIDWVETDESK